MKKEPRYINVRDSINSLWFLIDLDGISAIHQFAANGFGVQMSSGLSLHVSKREHARLMRHMNRRHVIA